ncbi:redoxin domain-containing protein [Candidatus Bathyarchaeota archaeon]|nr:MAG: redoxin domain-containing protein [Candidatus Bathyarchaeota archaeon]
MKKKILAVFISVLLSAMFCSRFVLTASDSEGATLIMGTTDSVESTIDPAQAYDFFGWEIIQNTGCTLVEVEPGSSATAEDYNPALATSWTTSSDLKTWTFTLRKSVLFDDGTEFNATHVKYSFDRSMGIASPDGPQLNMEYGAIIDNVDVVSKYVVKFNLKIPFGPFLALMACQASSIVNPEYAEGWKTNWSVNDIVYYTAGDPRASTPMDLGPYVLTKWTRVSGKDHEMTLEANPNYWKKAAGLPKTEKIIIKFYADATALRLAIEVGDIDVAFRHLRATDIEDLKANPDLKVWQGVGTAIQYMIFQQDPLAGLPQLDDSRVRRALTACLDRPEVCTTVFLDQAYPLYSMIPTGMMGRPEGVPGPFKVLGDANYTYAKSLLADLGYNEANKLEVELWYETSGHYPSSPDQAALYKEQIEASGVISVTLKSADWPHYRTNRNEGVMHVFIYGWYPDYIDPDNYCFLYSAHAAWLNHHYAKYNATNNYIALKAAYDAARATTNDTERISLYNELEDYAVEDCPLVPIWQGAAWAVTKPNIKGVYLDITQSWRMWYLYSTPAYMPDTILPLADTYVDAFSVDTAYGDRDYLEVADYASGFSITSLMFDISEVPDNPDPSFRAQLRLYCFNIADPLTVGVHWCVNNTWSEEDLNFISFSEFFRTSLADIVRVDSVDTWYEWNVTSFIRTAREENYERITLALEVQDTLDGTALSQFASKDQATPEMLEYSPQLAYSMHASSNGYPVAPDFILTDIDGNSFSLSDYHGRVVLLNFFATWCAPCVYQIPHLAEINRNYNSGKVKIMSISSSSDSEADLQQFRNTHGMDWIVARDTDGVFDKYNVSYITTLVIIDQDGYIRYRHVGFTEASVLSQEMHECMPDPEDYTKEYESTVAHWQSKFYTFDASAGQTATIVTTSRGSLSEVHVYVRYNDELISWRTVGSMQSKTIQFMVALSRTYQIEVYGSNIGEVFWGAHGNRFRLEITVSFGNFKRGNEIGIIVNNYHGSLYTVGGVGEYSNSVGFIGNRWGSTIIQPPYTREKNRGFNAIVVFYDEHYEDRFTSDFGPVAINALVDHVNNGGSLFVQQHGLHDNLMILLSNFDISIILSGVRKQAEDNEIYWVNHPIFYDIDSLSGGIYSGITHRTNQSGREIGFVHGTDSFAATYEDSGKIISYSGSIFENDFFHKKDNSLLLKNTIDWLLDENEPFVEEPPLPRQFLREKWVNNDIETYSGLSHTLRLHDEDLYVFGSDRSIQSLNTDDGQEVWKYALDSYAHDAISDGQKVYIATSDAIYALDFHTGDLVWNRPYSVSSGLCLYDDMLFFGSGSSLFSVESSDGDLIWRLDVEIEARPVMLNDRLIVGGDHLVEARDPETGALLWRSWMYGEMYGWNPPAVSEDYDLFFCGTASGHVCAFEGSSGEILWDFWTGSAIHNSLVLSDNDDLYAYPENGVLFSLNMFSGKVNWFRFLDDNRDYEDYLPSPTYVNASVLITSRKNMYMFDVSTGGELYKRGFNSEIETEAMVKETEQRYLIIATTIGGSIYALQSLTSNALGSLQVEVEGAHPGALILYDSKWNEITRVHPSGSTHTFFGLKPGIYHVEARRYDMWIGEAVNIGVNEEQTSTRVVTPLALRHVNVTGYYSDGVTPLSGGKVRIYSYDHEHDSYNYRDEILLGDNGKRFIVFWPTSKAGEHYKILVFYNGNQVGSNSNVTVDKDVDSEITFITDASFEGTRISPQHISLIGQETRVSCWAASSAMVLNFYGTYSGREYSRDIDFASEIGLLWDWYYYHTGLKEVELIPFIGRWESTMERLGRLDFYRDSDLTFEDVMDDMHNNRPIMALYYDHGVGHVVVIVGYVDRPGSDDDSVVINDPSPLGEGEVQIKPWKDVKARMLYALGPIRINAIRTLSQTIEGTILVFQESQHKLYLHIYDSQERHVGMNYTLDKVEVEIPDAKYLDFNTTTMVVLPPNISDFRYVIDAKYATEVIEDYSLVITSLRQGTLISEIKKSGVIEQGDEIEDTLYVSTGGSISGIETKSWWMGYAPWLIFGAICIVVASASVIFRRRGKNTKD